MLVDTLERTTESDEINSTKAAFDESAENGGACKATMLSKRSRTEREGDEIVVHIAKPVPAIPSWFKGVRFCSPDHRIPELT